MKILSILLVVGAVILGIFDGDCTGAVILAVLLCPVIFERKESHREKQSGELFLGGIEVREHRQ